jgi:glycosyltransferase involved in cell wall biosynthesis
MFGEKREVKVAVVIPAFNEVMTAEATIKPFLDLQNVSQVVFVDNNSNDGTLQVVLDIQKMNPKLIVIKELKQGKGFAIRKAFQTIDADFYVMVDADSTYSPNDFQRMLDAAMNENVDLVVGNRLANNVYASQNSRPFHNFGNHLIKGIINKLYGATLEDILSGYRVMSKRFVEGFPILSRGFELETEITLHALDRGYSILEIPVSYFPRPSGSESKLRTFYHGRKILLRIFKIYRIFQPMRFFGFVSFLIFTSALFFGYKPLYDFIQFQYVYHVPLAVLSSSLIVLSALTLMTAFILDAVADLGRKNFETFQNRVKE